MGEGLRCQDNVHCDFEIDRLIEDSRVSAALMKTNCVQFRQSVRPNRTISCLGTNMEKYSACENCVDHSCHPRLREYLFEASLKLKMCYSHYQEQMVIWLVIQYYYN